MRKCGYCGQENVTGNHVCMICGSELVPNGPPPLVDHEFVSDGHVRRVVARLSRVRQAEFMRDTLTGAGIDACIDDRSERGFLGFVNPIGRILVHVPEAQSAAALEAIRRTMPLLLPPVSPASPANPIEDAGLTNPADNLVTVARCRTVVEANLVKLHLERAGIEACVPEELTPQIFWYMIPSPLEEVTVRVKARDEAAARQALAEGPGPELPPPPPPS